MAGGLPVLRLGGAAGGGGDNLGFFRFDLFAGEGVFLNLGGGKKDLPVFLRF